MKPWINKGMMLLFFVCIVVYLVWSAIHRPRVLVLQSYGLDYDWTRDVNNSIKKGFLGKPYDVQYHFMDTKTHSDPEFKYIAGSRARKRINNWKPDVLIAVDDNAQSLVAVCYMDSAKVNINNIRSAKNPAVRAIFGQCRKDHPDLKVVFVGIGAEPEDYGYNGQNNVTGILERMDHPALLETIIQIANVQKKSKMVVTAPIDDSTSGIYNLDGLQNLKKEAAPFGVTIQPQQIKTFAKWKQMVEKANKNADLLLISNYHTIKCNSSPKSARVSPGDLIAWTQANSSIPGLGGWGFYVTDGGMLSVAVSPFEQGEVAARLAIKILEGAKPSSLPIETTHQSIIFMNKALEQYYGLSLPRIYEAFARATDNFIPCKSKDCRIDIQQIKKIKENKRPATFCENSAVKRN
ncbi:MAG: hypothetical protein HQL71_14750 [Magnetococcales bacterium]|nr:hypothetical protein [Magnetococcales bacterium]